ncbi:MAG: amidohydrolase family protein [Acidimicrobiales bacterium]|nr:amidohydrolase family protein [Acidimicrobiales bacterium]
MPTNIPIIDTMIGFPHADFSQYDFIRKQTKDTQSKDEYDFPVEYMFKGVPKELYGTDQDPVQITLGQMDRFNVAKGMISCEDPLGQRALKEHPDRFIPSCGIDPNDVMGAVRKLDELKRDWGLKAATAFPSGCFPQVPIDDAKFYPVYAKCVELDIPIFVCSGVPGPRFPFSPQHVERIDRVMYDFPELTFVTRHGCEPWDDLAVKLMLKWPGLHYSTSAFAPKHYPKSIIKYANSRGADKIVYAGYFPMGLSLERIMTDMQKVEFKDDVWPKFLNENAKRVLRLDD